MRPGAPPCRELDETTFHDAAVVKQAQNGFVMIKVDVTKGGNPTHERLLQEYAVKGVPTVVFINADGKECAMTCACWISCRRTRCSPA